MTSKTITVRANRSFSTIQDGDVVTIDEGDARMLAFLYSGYLTEVTGDNAKGAKKVDTLGEETPEIVWDGEAGNRRGARTNEPVSTRDADAVAKTEAATAKTEAAAAKSDAAAAKVADAKAAAVAAKNGTTKESHGDR